MSLLALARCVSKSLPEVEGRQPGGRRLCCEGVASRRSRAATQGDENLHSAEELVALHLLRGQGRVLNRELDRESS